MTRFFTTAPLLLCCLAIAAPPVFAQELTAADSVPAEPSTVENGRGPGVKEKAERWAKQHQIVGRINGDVDGWYPRLGGITRGGGFALGPGYRAHLRDTGIRADLSAGFSTKSYKAVDARMRWLQARDGRAELWTDYRFEDFPQEDFFGRGLTSSPATRTSYDYGSQDVSVRGIVRPVEPWRVGVIIGLMRPDISPGSDRNYRSIEQVFTDVDAPGLAAQPTFLHSTFFTSIDSRDVPGNPHSGGFYQAAFGIWNDRTLEQYDFRRFDAQARHYVPITSGKRHVVSGHVGVSYVNNAPGKRVPFYFLPYVGGRDTVRSFPEFRFKDENALWMNVEYKWTFIEYLSAVAFLDAGEVRVDWEDINPRGLKKGYGLGVQVHTKKVTLAQLNVGTGGGESWQVFFNLGMGF